MDFGLVYSFYPAVDNLCEKNRYEFILICDRHHGFVAAQAKPCMDMPGIDLSDVIGCRCSDLFDGKICPKCPFDDAANSQASFSCKYVDGNDGRWCKIKANCISMISQGETIEKVITIIEVELSPGSAECRDLCGAIIGQHPEMQALYRLIEKISRSDISVLIGGETGTGKGLVAQTIHELSPRTKGPFVPINCATMPHSLVEHELFGREKGAFTGATDSRAGRLEQANGGTVFLDEIGDLPLEMQVKLLQVIEDKKVARLGLGHSRPLDVRFVCATNKDLSALIKQGAFRKDLYHRLKCIAFHLPPLRERLSDLPLLTTHFLDDISKKAGRGAVDISPAAVNMLMRYDWPGNVRELQHVLEAAAVLCDGYTIKPEDLPVEIEHSCNGYRSWGRLEKDDMMEMLRASRWNQSETARRLGVDRSVLRRRMKALGIQIPK